MSRTEIFIVYFSPLILVIGGGLMAWRNHVVMRHIHARDRQDQQSTTHAT